MNKRLLFKEVKNIEDFKVVITENMDYITSRICGFMPEETLNMALQGLSSFPKEQEKNFISFVKRVDKSYSSPGACNGNAWHKLPAVLAGSIYYNYYPETISELTLDEMALLSYFSFVTPITFYETSVEKYGKELLSAIIEKTKNDRYDSMAVLMLADKMMKEDLKTKEETTEYVKKTTTEQLLEEEAEYSKEMFANVRIPW